MNTLRKTSKKKFQKNLWIILLNFMFVYMANAQIQNPYNLAPQVPQPASFQTITVGNPNIYNPNAVNPQTLMNLEQQRIQQQNQRIIQATLQQQQNRRQQLQQIYAELENENRHINYSLPSHLNKKGASAYLKAFDSLQKFSDDYPLKKAVFIVENAFYENKHSYEEFDKVIKNIGKFLLRKMDEFGYDKNSNLAKNLILFRFFSDTLQFNKKGLMHLPINYDFNDAFGDQNWTKMFVTKLLSTNTGQCSSMPRLYLILAEEIGAEAYLAFSPNHSYIRFPDDNLHWYNVELTNHMFTTNSMILSSGYVKSEALVNKIYMNNLSKKQLLAQTFVELASGYIHKYGYDTFVEKIVSKALEIDNKNINANMALSNYYTVRFEYVMKQLGINPRNHNELQNIRYFPQAITLLKQTNQQYKKIDDLGFEFMSQEAYDNWLNSLKKMHEMEKSKQIENRIKLNVNKLKD